MDGTKISLEHTARSLCTRIMSLSIWSQSNNSISNLLENSADLLVGFTFFSPTAAGTKVVGRFDTSEFDDFDLLLETSVIDVFLVNAFVRSKMQSAAATERRVGNSNPSCTVLQIQMLEHEKSKQDEFIKTQSFMLKNNREPWKETIMLARDLRLLTQKVTTRHDLSNNDMDSKPKKINMMNELKQYINPKADT